MRSFYGTFCDVEIGDVVVSADPPRTLTIEKIGPVGTLSHASGAVRRIAGCMIGPENAPVKFDTTIRASTPVCILRGRIQGVTLGKP